jgi:NitT/TauT family transport system permease protein
MTQPSIETRHTPAAPPRSGERNLSQYAGPLLSLVVLLVAWEYLPLYFAIPTYILPRLSQVIAVFLDPMAISLYVDHGKETLIAALYGFFLGSLLGIACAIVLNSSKLLMSIVYPYVIAFQSMPKAAVAPLLIVWFGYGAAPKIIVVSALCFFPVLVNTILGLRSVSSEYRELFRAIKSPRVSLFLHLLVPSALPSVITGLELAAVVALLGAIITEFVGAEKGLGVLILQAQYLMNIPGVFSLLILLALLGVIFNLALRIFRRRTLFWIAGEQTF